MKEIYFLTANEYLYTSLKRFLKYNLSVCLKSLIPQEILIKESEDICHKYNYISDRVKSMLPDNKKPLIIIDTFSDGFSIDSNEINIKSSGNLSAMLYITFPEVHWVFLSAGINHTEGSECNYYNPEAFNELHILDVKDLGKLKSNFKRIYKSYNNRYEPLFDPTGFRNLLKSKLFIESYKSDSERKKYNTNRNISAISIDDEINYSYFYSYYAYMHGLRVWNINSYNFLVEYARENAEKEKKELFKQNLEYSFEDLFISYYDKESTRHLSELCERDKEFPLLRQIKNRFILTVGHSNKRFRAIKIANEIYRAGINSSGSRIKRIFKPIPSIYGLNKKAKISIKDFKWPIDIKEYESDDHHSSPGRIKEIAERMIIRAEEILKERRSLPDLIRGAVLARESHEMLANRTPTITLRALDVRHELEVTFECLFEGVDYKLHAKERIEALKKEVISICKWFQKGSIRKRAEISSLSSIIGKLVIRFRENNQFDEEDYAIAELRKLQGKLMLVKSRLHKVTYPFRWYLEMLLRSVRFFVFAVLFWIILFGTIWYFYGLLAKCGNNPGYTTYILHSLQAFLSFSVPDDIITNSNYTFGKLFLVGAPLVLGFIHLGVFISHLYNKFYRR